MFIHTHTRMDAPQGRNFFFCFVLCCVHSACQALGIQVGTAGLLPALSGPTGTDRCTTHIDTKVRAATNSHPSDSELGGC